MWSGPRNMSTALMYAFAARGDCSVWDEPFYAAYLAATGIDHPMRDDVIAAGEVDAAKVAAACLGPQPAGRAIWYQKHMTMHMLPEFDRAFMRGLTNVFLIRHPARVVASYSKKREAPTLADIGFVQQAKLFEQVALFSGKIPLVVDSADIRADPRGTLGRLCAALGISFVEGMLYWEAGPKPYDGVWAPHWYNAVHASTGIEKPEGPLSSLAADYAPLVEQALPYYQRLAVHRI
ncbi:MAG: HAD family hydrolase [Rhodobacteraceae bacterium]|nr:HAD family hydrolase [Paracoccaceae bacterium]